MQEERIVLGANLLRVVASDEVQTVWQARRGDGGLVAIHLLNADAAATARGESFRRIARFLQSLTPSGEAGVGPGCGVLQVHDVAEDGDAFAADLWTVGNVGDVGALGWELPRRLEFFRDVCGAVRALHARDVYCGSLHPTSIVFADDLKPVLTEVGLFHSGHVSHEHLAYAAPETAAGMPVDARSDVFAAGRLLQFLLDDLSAPEGDEPLPRLEALAVAAPAGLARIVRRCVLPDPTRRYANLDELTADLTQFRDTANVGVGHPDVSEEVRVTAIPRLPNSKMRARLPSAGGADNGADAAAARAKEPARYGATSSPLASDLNARQRGIIAASGLTVSAIAIFSAWKFSSSAGVFVALYVVGGTAAAAVLPAAPKRPVVSRLALAFVACLLLLVVDPVSRLALAGGRAQLASGNMATRAQSIQALIARGEQHFEGMALTGADLSGAWLMEASFDGADLTGANLTGATMASASLRNAKFAQAKLTRANLGDADLSGAEVADAIGFEQAVCSEGTRLPAGWACTQARPARLP